MKKFLVLLLTVCLSFCLFGCTSTEKESGNEEQTTSVDLGDIQIGFVPSKDAQVILDAAANLPAVLKEKLEAKGYTVGEITMTVGTDFAVVGEGMESGSIEIGFLNTVTYASFAGENVQLCVEALRNGVADANGKIFENNCDFDLYNQGITTDAAELVTGYPGLIYVNVGTEKGADLYAKAVAGTLTWEDVNTAAWQSSGVSSSSGYIYPSLWVNNLFGEGAGNEVRTLSNLDNLTINSSGYASMMSNLLAQQCDVIVGYSDVRKDQASTDDFNTLKGEGYYAEFENVWDVIKVIGASAYIMNDTVSLSANENAFNGNYSEQLLADIQEIFLEFSGSEEYMAMFAPYSHKGYAIGTDADYDPAREAAKIFAE